MLVQTSSLLDRAAAIERPRQISRPSDNGEALDKSMVAELTANSIDCMTCEELRRVIRVADLPIRDHAEYQRRLGLYDRETLKRLAFLSRRSCQNHENHGTDPWCNGSPLVLDYQ